MNVTVIYGNIKNTNTYDCVQLLLNTLKKNIKIKTNEFFLPESYFDNNYYTYTKNYLNIYSNTTITDSIIKSLGNSDLIILASTVFMCDISSEMKILLNNLSNHRMENSLNSLMNNKIGLVISTSAGAGLPYTAKTLKKSLQHLGINNTFKFYKTLYESNLENVNYKTRKKISKQISKLSYKILDLYLSPRPLKSSLLSKIVSPKINTALKTSSNYNVIDINSWKRQTCYHHGKNI
ncbi:MULTISPECIES: NAD(P)H-dependent oxidoreductase [unclassified Clostridium]|uniref:NAD(P)H-dependent oxidoreductase n=1 Tax=unclassified Clostridium TaxID=2614128 RepID=UPI0002975D13|nr:MULTISPECIES: NAD(P)H-dependent oxidoreductase [unclassified Clostridium]EKQ50495.1 MAG: NADPH-dependent FMN reductase [Clostridium sp. Maddingley MBC34-26]